MKKKVSRKSQFKFALSVDVKLLDLDCTVCCLRLWRWQRCLRRLETPWFVSTANVSKWILGKVEVEKSCNWMFDFIEQTLRVWSTDVLSRLFTLEVVLFSKQEEAMQKTVIPSTKILKWLQCKPNEKMNNSSWIDTKTYLWKAF